MSEKGSQKDSGGKYIPYKRWVFQSSTDFGEATKAVHAKGVRAETAERASEGYKNSRQWSGGLNLPQAMDMAADGARWEEGIARMRPVHIDDELDGRLRREVPEIHSAVHGFMPLVPAYLAGVPESMLAMDTPPAKEPVLRVGVSFVHSAGTSAEAIIRRGVAMLSVIDALEIAGHTIELWGVYRVRCRKTNRVGSIEVCVKHAGEFWDPGAVAFILAHPASGRRVGFRWMEAQSEAPGWHSGGYGAGDGLSWQDFDVAFDYMMGDDGYKSDEQAIETVKNKILDGIAKRRETKENGAYR